MAPTSGASPHPLEFPVDKITDNLPFKPSLIGVGLFIVAVAAALYVARKIPVLNKIA